jgi:hypothetical protein
MHSCISSRVIWSRGLNLNVFGEKILNLLSVPKLKYSPLIGLAPFFIPVK